MQVDPIKPTVITPGTKRLELRCVEPLSISAFNINSRRYTEYSDSQRLSGSSSGIGRDGYSESQRGIGSGGGRGSGGDAEREQSPFDEQVQLRMRAEAGEY